MDWTTRIDGYCERVGFGYWDEPVNAVTNLAFVAVAMWLWPRMKGSSAARGLCAILFAIGVGSWLFHTHAIGWAALADILPIGLFILVYLYLVNRDVLRLRVWTALGATALFVPYAALVTIAANALPFFRISNFYWTVPLLLLLYGLYLHRRAPVIARGFWIGAGLLSVSIIARSLDMPICGTVPLGTHFIWHVLNALMLGWMIHLYASRIAPAAPLAGSRGAR